MKLTDTIIENYADIKADTLLEKKESVNKKVQNLLDIWKEEYTYAKKTINSNWNSHNNYELTVDEELRKNLSFLFQRKKIDYSQSDITEISLRVAEEEQKELFDTAGTFLASLIQYHFAVTKTQREYLLLLSNIDKKIINLGMRNSANVRIESDKKNAHLDNICFEMQGGTVQVKGHCNYAGYRMHNGKLMINGSVTSALGEYQFGGSIIVSGDAYNDVGSFMNGGEIIVQGKVHGLIGANMKGGKIKIIGELPKLSQYSLGDNSKTGGEIYYKDTLLWPKR